MSNDNEEREPIIPKILLPWIELFVGIVTVLGVLWAIVQFFYPFHNTDMTVWIQKEIPVERPSLVGSAPLELLYEGTPINRATVLQVNVSNTGSTPIGKKGEWEEIILRPDNNARIALLSQPVIHPSNLEFQVHSNSLTDTLTLQVGLFNPRDSIELQLIIIDPQDVSHPIITAETRIPNLSEATTTRKSIEDRLSIALSLPVTIFVLLLVVIITFVKFRPKSQKIDLDVIRDYLVRIVAAIGVLSYVLTKLIIWLIMNSQIR
jgi:hypothetical protein